MLTPSLQLICNMKIITPNKVSLRVIEHLQGVWDTVMAQCFLEAIFCDLECPSLPSLLMEPCSFLAAPRPPSPF